MSRPPPISSARHPHRDPALYPNAKPARAAPQAVSPTMGITTHAKTPVKLRAIAAVKASMLAAAANTTTGPDNDQRSFRCLHA